MSVAIERPLPHNLEAERSILGAVLLENHSLNDAAEKLKTEDFFLAQHRLIFAQMLEMAERQQPIDTITLVEYLDRKRQLEAAGGVAYLSQLTDGLPRLTNVGHYAQIVKEKSMLRATVYTANAIQEQALAGGDDAEAILDRAESAIFQLAEDRVRQGLQSIKEVVRSSFAQLEKTFSEGRHITGLPTGYIDLDNITAGLQPQELTIIAARPSMGKTALALNIAENVAIREKQPVAIFTLEMSSHALLLRMLSSVARVDTQKFRNGHLSREDWTKITESLVALADVPLWMYDFASPTVTQIAAMARRQKRQRGLALVIVDYLQLVTASNPRRNANRQEDVASISRGLKAMAKELDVPVIAMSQLTRGPEREDRRPVLSDLRESGEIEQDADVVLFIHRPNFYKADLPEADRAKTELLVAKQRNGPTGLLNFTFVARHTRFEEAVPDAWSTPMQEGE